LYASQGDVVFVCQIKRRDVNEAKAKDLPEHFVEITSKFRLEDQVIYTNFYVHKVHHWDKLG
jgi:hypothetical protein